MAEYIEMVICSFLTSYGLAVVFRIDRKNLLRAGLGGALTRVIYLIMLEATSLTVVQSFVAATCAALYAELMAMRRRMPSTVFLYPSILPLIPGGTLYYIAIYAIMGDLSMTISYVWECVLQLSGMCMGFVIISTFTYYRRIYYLGAHLEAFLKRSFRSLTGRAGH